MFSPNLGRFISLDPKGFAAGDPNLYRAEGNNPVNEVDPSGLEGQPTSITADVASPSLATLPPLTRTLFYREFNCGDWVPVVAFSQLPFPIAGLPPTERCETNANACRATPGFAETTARDTAGILLKALQPAPATLPPKLSSGLGRSGVGNNNPTKENSSGKEQRDLRQKYFMSDLLQGLLPRYWQWRLSFPKPVAPPPRPVLPVAPPPRPVG